MPTARCVVLAIILCASAAAKGQEIRLDPLPSGLCDRIGLNIPQRLELSDKPPAEMVNPPKNLVWPLYGVLPIGNKSLAKKIYFVLDSDGPDSPRARLWTQVERGADFSELQAADWQAKKITSKDGATYTEYEGGITIDLGAGGHPFMAHLGIYAHDPRDPAEADAKRSLFYYADYARVGRMKFGDRSYDVILFDRYATGDFSNQTQPPGAASATSTSVRLWIDRKGDGKFASTEKYDVDKPFAIDGVTYELADISPSGDHFTLRRSEKTVTELPVPPDYAVGKPILPFVATTMDGKTVHFPSDYKGKIVALDFWATWCGPCMTEEPTLVATFEKLHTHGLEVLGVSLDAPADRAKLIETTGRLRMAWPEIFDGKAWDSGLVVNYGLASIPAMFLVDGDTGLILAQDKSLSGDLMQSTIEKAMRKKELLQSKN